MSGEELARQSQDGVRSHVVLPTQECLFQFDSLPHIISRKVFSLLTFEELGKAALVCKQWYDRCRDPILWRRLSLNEHKLNVTDEVLVRLTSLSDVITHLDITECRKISANCVLECLRRCGFLEEMRAVRCRAFNDACLECLGQTSRGLRTIDMSLCPVSDEGVQKLSQGCPNLESVTMNQCSKLTNQSLEYITDNCPKLTYVSVEYNKMDDGGLKRLVQECPLLKTLHLNTCSITNEGVQAVAQNCHNLEVLDVRHTVSMDDATVRDIALYCPKLQHLNLSLCFEVTDLSIKHILQFCGSLRHLFLVHCKITDTGLNYFITLEPACLLERLDLSWCQAITDAGVQDVVKGCRGLKHLGLVRCDNVSEATVSTLSDRHPQLFLSTVQTEMNRIFDKVPPQQNDTLPT